jgi:hypothetical protein
VGIEIQSLQIMEGTIQPRAMGPVMEWAAKNQDALMEDWNLAEKRAPLNKIAPLR